MKLVAVDSSVGLAGLTEAVALGLLVAVCSGTAVRDRQTLSRCEKVVVDLETGLTAKAASVAGYVVGYSSLGAVIALGVVELRGCQTACKFPFHSNLQGTLG